MTRLAIPDSNTSPYSRDTDMVVFKAKLSAPGRCPQPCRCRCHSSRPSTFSSVGWARNLVGHLFVAYDRKLTFGNNVECSEPLCKGNKRSVVTFKYQFPAWLCSRYLSAQASMDILTGLSASLRPVRVLPMNDGVIASIHYRGREAVQWRMQNGNLIFPDDRQCDGKTALEWAIRGGTADALEFLIEFWVEQLRKDSYNPDWYFAAKHELRWRPFMPEQEERALRVITSFGEDIVDAVQTPLHDAACIVDDDPRAKQEIRDAFSKYPWAINLWNYEGSTPLTLASECGNLEAVRELISVGCDINCSDYAGQTALMRAADNGHSCIVECLLDAGCPVDATSSTGRTALMDAARPTREPDGDPTEIIRILLSAGASTKLQDLWGDTVLAYLGKRETTAAATEAKFHLLLAAGADINSCDATGESPLQQAIARNTKYVMRYLIEAGAEVQWFRQYRVNLLHYVALHSGLEALQELARMQLPRLNTDMLDEDGDTPWDCFIYTVHSPDWRLGDFRSPNPQEIECFVSLYKNMREQNLQLDIGRLQRTRQYLADANQRGASAALEPLIKEKKEWEQWESLSTYKAILLQVKQEMWEAAIESVDENIEVLQERIAQDPWDQESYWDYLKNSGSEDSEDEVSSLGSDESEYQDCEEDEDSEVRDHE
nr:PFS domain-containing protein [Colletotrichum truncatum]KAF6784195.1 PFS domain-containing protein [Colletotrichum truncatum]